jgi:hypothetical protein
VVQQPRLAKQHQRLREVRNEPQSLVGNRPACGFPSRHRSDDNAGRACRPNPAGSALEVDPDPPLRPSIRQPKRIELKNGVVIFINEDHDLTFINGSISIKGGERDVPAGKAGLVDLYGDTWRTSGTATRNGDQLDDLLEAKAAKVETGGDVDSTAVSWSCLKADEDQVFDIAVDLLEHPKFDEQKLNPAKQQAATSIVRRNDDAGRDCRPGGGSPGLRQGQSLCSVSRKSRRLCRSPSPISSSSTTRRWRPTTY